jgi:hypothetical protein
VTRGPTEREKARHIIESELGMSCLDLTMEPRESNSVVD